MPARAAANVIVGIVADDRTKAGVDSAKSSLQGLSGAAAGALGAASAAALGLGGAILGAGGAALGTVANFAQTADALAKMSQRTGVSVESLSGLRHAFSLSDLSAADLEKTFRRVNSRLITGARATESTHEALAELGLVQEEFANLSPEEAFKKLADSIASIEDPARRSSLAADTLGQNLGPRLLTVLEGGAAGINDLQEEAESLGIVVGEETANQAATFNDNLERMGAFTEGLGNTLSEKLLPILNTMIETALPLMEDLFERISPILESAGAVVGELATQFLALVGPVLEFVESGVGDIFANLFGEGGESGGLSEDFERINSQIGELVESITEVLGPVINTLADIFGRVFGFISEVVGIVFEHIGGILSSFIDVVISVVDFISAIFSGDFSKIFEAAGNIVEKVFTFIGNIIGYAVDIVISLIKNLGSGIVKFGIEGFNNFLGIVEDVVNGVRNLFFDMADAVLDIINSMVNGVIDAMLAIVSPIAGTIADIGGFASNLRDTLLGARVDFSVDRGSPVTIDRIALPSWVTEAEAGAAARAAPVLDVAAGLGIPVSRTNTIQNIQVNNINLPNYVGNEDDLFAAVNRGIQTGNVGVR